MMFDTILLFLFDRLRLIYDLRFRQKPLDATFLHDRPRLRGKKLGLDGLLELAESKLGEHILYARLLNDPHGLEKKYKVMDLSKPMIDKNDKKFLDKFMIEPTPEFLPKIFLKMYNTDNLGNLIRNVDVWLKERFEKLV